MPTSPDATIAALRARLDQLSAQGHALELEGLPFPTLQIRNAFENAVDGESLADATRIVKGGETLLAKVTKDWAWVREVLRRADELRAIAATLGVDLQHLDTRVGNPRTRLQTDPLSSGSMEKAAASASLALAVLNDAIPKFCVQEAQNLGESIRRARDRGEEVTDAARSLNRLLQAVQDQNLSLCAQRLVETRRSVSRIPRAPALPTGGPQEEEEILREARNLARRLQRIKGKARDAQSAARLMSQVRAALSEDRRYGTPEEEIEALWLEVDRITRERKLATDGQPLETEEAELPAEGAIAEPNGVAPGASRESEREGAHTTAADQEEQATSEEEDRDRAAPYVPYNPYVPPDIPGVTTPDADRENAAARARKQAARPRP